ncbi:MAG: phosphate/phosphite/phosphonate ABC transporter substrate-binding protein [Chloroflexota bacterium]|nr:phosphate/phosphite/phosphonate ABC transporter substrate-binding protein [Chloroflexota bacterium]MDE3192743.1 phosphate/phosphite/phosphonate ABC transporter substrate-binding protein [Chloroflexota bacterium]
MHRTLRAPLGLTLALVAVVSAACGGTAAPTTSAQPSAAAASPAASKGPRLGSFDRPIVMAFVPSQDTARITASGKAIAASLEKATALKWDVKVPTSYAATIEGMCAGQIDVAWLAPLSYVTAHQKNCANVLLASVRNDETGKPSTTYNSQIVVRSDSGIKDLAGLKGKKFAFVDPLSTSGTLFPMVQIKQQTNMEPKAFFSQTIFAGGHDKSMLAVYQGQVDGAASFIDARDQLEKTFPDIKQKTTRILTAGPIPNDTVSVRSGFPQDLATQIQKALLDYAKTDDGKKALKALYSIDGLATTDAKLYDPLLAAAKIAGLDLEKEAQATAVPVKTAAPSPTKAP